MKYNHMVKFGGVFYEAGEEVPTGEAIEKSVVSSAISHKYTEADVNVPYNELRSMCKAEGITIAKNSKADELKKLLLEL